MFFFFKKYLKKNLLLFIVSYKNLTIKILESLNLYIYIFILYLYIYKF